MKKHSELPWKVIQMNGSRGLYIETEHKKGWNKFPIAVIIPNQDAKANASFIVRAVNNHERLVEALKLIDKWISESFHSGAINEQYLNVAKQAIQSAREVL